MQRILAWLLISLTLTACSVEEQRLTLVKPRLEIDLKVAEDFARVLDRPGRVQVVLIDNPDPARPGIEAVKQGLADLALAPNTEHYDPRVAAVVPLYPTILHIAYRVTPETADRSMEDVIADLRNRTVFAGPPGSPSRTLLETAALRKQIRPEEINYSTAAQECADVLVAYAAVSPAVQQNIESCGRYRLFSLGTPEQIGAGGSIDSVTLLHPMLKPFVIPADTYGDLTPGPVVTLAVDKLLVARAELPETVIYDLLQEIMRLKPALAASNSRLFHELSDRFDDSGMAFVTHPGALAYLHRDEPGLLERYSGVAEVLVTLMIGLISGSYAVWRIFLIRRKNRIDAFCREALQLRDRYAEGQVAGAATVAALKSLQDRAYELLIRERLAADESFRIFITLCNDIMSDISGAERDRRS